MNCATQVEAACLLPEVTEVLVDFLEARGVPIALAAIKTAGKIAVAVSPRVVKVTTHYTNERR